MKIVLNKTDVIEKARAAFLRGELQCQQEGFTPSFTPCRYDGPCAIGVALTRSQRNYLEYEMGAGGIKSFCDDGIVVCSAEDAEFFDLLQSAHDIGSLERLGRLLGVE